MANDEQYQSDLDTELASAIGEFLEAMPASLTPQDRFRLLVRAAVRAADLPAESAWCAVAAVVSDAHGGRTAQVRVTMPIEGDDEHEDMYMFNSTGTSSVVRVDVVRAPPRTH